MVELMIALSRLNVMSQRLLRAVLLVAFDGVVGGVCARVNIGALLLLLLLLPRPLHSSCFCSSSCASKTVQTNDRVPSNSS